MRKKLFAALALMLGLLGGAVAIESPAAASFSDCPSGTFCMWDGPSGTGSRLDIHFPGAELQCIFLTPYWQTHVVSEQDNLFSNRAVLQFSGACATDGSIHIDYILGNGQSVTFQPWQPIYHHVATILIGRPQ